MQSKSVAKGKELDKTLVFTLSLAVGMTPQLLPAITSVVLAAGAKAMARQQVIVKQLLAIENLGSMTVLCSDKTGTLTEGVIHLQETLDVAGRPSDRVLRLAWLNAHFQAGFENPIDRSIRDRQTFDTFGIEKLDEIPYDFIRKRLSVRIRETDGTVAARSPRGPWRTSWSAARRPKPLPVSWSTSSRSENKSTADLRK